MTNPLSQCQALSSSSVDNTTMYVISICTDHRDSEFFITSFVSSQPFTMGPYKSPVYISSSKYIVIVNQLLFVLD